MSNRKERRAQARAAGTHIAPPSAGPSAPSKVVLNTAFGPVEVSEAVARGLAAGVPSRQPDADFTILDLSDCEHELTLASPAMVRRALIEGERLDPVVADQLMRDFGLVTPALMVFGERGRLLAAGPTLRRVRRAFLHPGNIHADLLGMVYDLPRVVLAQFANGSASQAAADELAKMVEWWDGRLLIVLVAGAPSEHSPIAKGNIVAAHEVDLDRPVLWHRGERGRR